MHSKHIHIWCPEREHGRRKITCTRYRDRRRSLRALEKAIGRALCVSLETIDPTPGRLRSSDACVCTIRSIAPVHRHANSTRPHHGIVHRRAHTAQAHSTQAHCASATQGTRTRERIAQAVPSSRVHTHTRAHPTHSMGCADERCACTGMERRARKAQANTGCARGTGEHLRAMCAGHVLLRP